MITMNYYYFGFISCISQANFPLIIKINKSPYKYPISN